MEEGGEAAEPQRIEPHMTSLKQLDRFMVYFGESMFLPNRLFFHVFWTRTLQWLRETGEAMWADYFEGQYLRRDQQQHFCATWWCGMTNTLVHAPTQQPAEAAWSSLKRMLQPLSTRTHCDLGNALEKVVSHWCSQPFQGEEETRRPMTRMPESLDSVSLSSPLTPDGWMLNETEGRELRRPGGWQCYFPSVPKILSKRDLMRDGRGFMDKLEFPYTIYMVMARGEPLRMPDGICNKMRAQVVARSPEELMASWKQEGILDLEDRTPKISLKNLRELWSKYVLLTADKGNRTITCSCWAHCWKRHCVHAWAVQELLGWRQVLPVPLPIPGPANAEEEEVTPS